MVPLNYGILSRSLSPHPFLTISKVATNNNGFECAILTGNFEFQRFFGKILSCTRFNNIITKKYNNLTNCSLIYDPWRPAQWMTSFCDYRVDSEFVVKQLQRGLFVQKSKWKWKLANDFFIIVCTFGHFLGLVSHMKVSGCVVLFAGVEIV